MTLKALGHGTNISMFNLFDSSKPSKLGQNSKVKSISLILLEFTLV